MSKFRVFHRTWWTPHGRPEPGKQRTIGYADTEEQARAMCRDWNTKHKPGPCGDRAEYTSCER